MLAVLLHPSARKELSRIPTYDREHIVEQLAVLEVCDHPLEQGRVIKLSGRKTEDFRMRVGDYRVKFTLRGQTVFVTEVENRQAGY